MGTLFSDNGGEFIALRDFLASKGISHLTSPPHTPEHNGLAERRHRHIVETGLTLLTKSKLPLQYWTYALSTTIYLISRMPTPNLSNNSPYPLLFNEPPKYAKLKNFGCLWYPWLRPYTSHKLEPCSLPCIFLGYSNTQSAYLCMDLSFHRVYVSRHVKFDESVFPYPQSLKPNTSDTSNFSKPNNQNPTHIPFSPNPVTQAHSPAPSGEAAPLGMDSSPGTSSAAPSTNELSHFEQNSSDGDSPARHKEESNDSSNDVVLQ